MADTVLWIILILVALLVGMYIGYHIRMACGPKTEARLHKDYLIALNFLLNEQADKAVELFIKMLKVDKDTIETHIALGNLFRKRGEVDRALSIHQQLLERSVLDSTQRVHALFELGQDYLNAGIFDRAEQYFREVISLDDTHVIALKRLLEIYQQERDFASCVMIAKKLEWVTGRSLHTTIAQYYCEEAEKAAQSKDEKASEMALTHALEFDPRCVRAYLLSGRALMKAQHYAEALQMFNHILQQAPHFLSEAANDIAHCYEALKDPDGFFNYLNTTLKKIQSPALIEWFARVIQSRSGEKAASEQIAEIVQKTPSFGTLNVLVQLQYALAEGEAKLDLDIVKTLIEKVIKHKPRYRCTHCGFEGRSLHWQCIGCKEWGVMQPIQGVEFA